MADQLRRAPVPVYERLRRPIFIIAYSAMAEMSDPRPFLTSTFGKFLYLLLVVSVIQELVYLRMERSAHFFARTRRVQARIERFKSRWTVNTRYRIGRTARYIFLIYAYGWLLNGVTDQCASPVSCVIYTPNLIRDSFGEIVYMGVTMVIMIGQFVLIFWFMSRFGTYDVILPETIKDRFSDVYGQDKALGSLREQLHLLESGEEVEALGGYMPKGVLLWGPPGTGKTLMMRAMAGESSVPFIYVGPGSFVNMFMGVNILKVKRVFKAVRTYALRYGGAIAFFDEIDSLGNRGAGVEGPQAQWYLPWNFFQPGRAHLTVDGVLRPAYFKNPKWAAHVIQGPEQMEQVAPSCFMTTDINPVTNVVPQGGQQGTLETFLAEIDGMEKPRGLINILRRLGGLKPLPPPVYKALFAGATNLREKLDAALLRSGRLSKQIKVPYPKVEGRIKTFDGYLAKVPNEVTDEDVEGLARFASRASGADIQEFVNEALLRSVREGRNVVTAVDLREAMIYKIAGDEVGRQEDRDAEYVIAIHEAGHAVAAHYLMDPTRWGITFGTIIERTSGFSGAIFYHEKVERSVQSQAEARQQVAIALASRVVEDMFEIPTMGHNGDGPAATNNAQRLVFVGADGGLSTLNNTQAFAAQRDPAEYHERVEKILQQARKVAYEVLESREDQVEELAQMFIREGTSDGDDIHELLYTMEAAR